MSNFKAAQQWSPKKKQEISKRAKQEIKGSSQSSAWSQPDTYPKVEQQYWTAELGVYFEDYLKELNPDKDPALRFFYGNKFPHQCKKCKSLRRVEYDPANDYTNLVWPLCQDCRYNGLKMMNYEYHMFIKDKEPPPPPQENEEHPHDES